MVLAQIVCCNNITIYRVIEREPTVTIELEWSRPSQTYGELQGYRLRYGVKDQILKEVSIKGNCLKFKMIMHSAPLCFRNPYHKLQDHRSRKRSRV